jgi:hypothetical protein
VFSADHQEHQAEHYVGVAQRIRFAGAGQHACDGEKAHYRVRAGNKPENNLEDFPDHRAVLSANDDSRNMNAGGARGYNAFCSRCL